MRRTAFQNVRYIHVLPVDSYRAQIFIEKLARRADKRDSGEILLFAGCLADKHKLRIFVADTEHRIRFCLAERTRTALFRRTLYFFKICVFHILLRIPYFFPSASSGKLRTFRVFLAKNAKPVSVKYNIIFVSRQS